MTAPPFQRAHCAMETSGQAAAFDEGLVALDKALACRLQAAPEPLPAPEAASLADLKWFEIFKDEQLQALIRTALGLGTRFGRLCPIGGSSVITTCTPAL